MFPGYVFVRFSADRDRWRSIFGTFGVTRLICSGDMPLAVPSDVMDELTAGAGLTSSALTPGQEVQIVNGPFAGFSARLMQMSSAGRVRVLLSILGGEIPLELKSDVLIPAA